MAGVFYIVRDSQGLSGEALRQWLTDRAGAMGMPEVCRPVLSLDGQRALLEADAVDARLTVEAGPMDAQGCVSFIDLEIGLWQEPRP